MSDKICMLDKERFCTNKLWRLNFLAPTFWNWRQNLIHSDFSGANIFGVRAAPGEICHVSLRVTGEN